MPQSWSSHMRPSLILYPDLTSNDTLGSLGWPEVSVSKISACTHIYMHLKIHWCKHVHVCVRPILLLLSDRAAPQNVTWFSTFHTRAQTAVQIWCSLELPWPTPVSVINSDVGLLVSKNSQQLLLLWSTSSAHTRTHSWELKTTIMSRWVAWCYQSDRISLSSQPRNGVHSFGCTW